MSQIDIFGNSIPQKDNIGVKEGLTVIENGEYIFYPSFFSKSEADFLLKDLRNTIVWKQESMNMYGKKIDFPRLTAWYGNNDKPYSFSGITLQPLPWSNDILKIKSKIEPVAKTEFNSVLLNLYRNGSDSISWHTDAEKELGINPVIASVNFGATRKFQLRHIKTKEKLEIELAHGSLLIMQGELQHFWQHQVPKTSKPVRERINLTFRVIK
jgi:alkylated DNA repair dioxygenase AlkB